MSVGVEYEVLVFTSVQVEFSIPGHSLTLLDRSIFRPMSLTPDKYGRGCVLKTTVENELL